MEMDIIEFGAEIGDDIDFPLHLRIILVDCGVNVGSEISVGSVCSLRMNLRLINNSSSFLIIAMNACACEFMEYHLRKFIIKFQSLQAYAEYNMT